MSKEKETVTEVKTEDLEVQAETGEEKTTSDPFQENLLDRLLFKGVLPRYAFPTDVATFYVFDTERSSGYRAQFKFTPSQGLPVALSQYAPGKEVWISGKCYTSGAIYSPIKDDRHKAWKNKKLYAECSNCGFSKTMNIKDGQRGERSDCPACGQSAAFGKTRYWLTPPGFAHPVEKEPRTSPDEIPERSYATRAKLVCQTPPDHERWELINPRLRLYDLRDHLIVTNSGPRKEGYVYCTSCGVVKPMALGFLGAHNKPYLDEREQICTDSRVSTEIVLGTEFVTDILLISLRIDPPLNLRPGLFHTEVVLRTLSDALTKACSNLLGIEPDEIAAEFRPALTENGKKGLEAEVFLYDTLPGGAGFAKQAGQLGEALFIEALKLLEECPEGCDKSCYRCLRSYRNKFDHSILDRYIGSSLLKHLITGDLPAVEEERLRKANEALVVDLNRQGQNKFKLHENKEIEVPGIGEITARILIESVDGKEYLIDIGSSLTPHHSLNDRIKDLMDFGATPSVIWVDELAVSSSLPTVTAELLGQIGV